MSSTHIPRKKVAVVDGDDDELRPEENGNSPTEPSYQYTPLPLAGNFIRLLELLPGANGSTLRCNLRAFNLDSFAPPPYRALSYTWGDSEYDHLMVEGKRVSMASELRKLYAIRHPMYCGSGRLLISTNLRDALRQLRHPTLPKKLWVDAVCINQDDDVERSHQIMLMARIYHTASQVWLWIGNRDAHTEIAFKTMKVLAKHFVEYQQSWTDGDNLPTVETLDDEDAMKEMLGLSSFRTGHFESLMKVFQRPVFQRIWCVQEIVVAAKIVVICGSPNLATSNIPYSALSNAIKFLDIANWRVHFEKTYLQGEDLMRYVLAVNCIQTGWFAKSLDRYSVVSDTRDFLATDSRDKIFALLGILGDFAHRGMHDLVRGGGSDLCADGHIPHCPHQQQRMEKTRNWAQNKWESGEAVESLTMAANTRIIEMCSDLIGFYRALRDFLDVATSVWRTERLADDIVLPNLEKGGGFPQHRKKIDDYIIKIQKQLDDLADEDVSSDELVSYRYTSLEIENVLESYEKVWKFCASGKYRTTKAPSPGSFLSEIETEIRRLRCEGEFNYMSSDFSSEAEFTEQTFACTKETESIHADTQDSVGEHGDNSSGVGGPSDAGNDTRDRPGSEAEDGANSQLSTESRDFDKDESIKEEDDSHAKHSDKAPKESHCVGHAHNTAGSAPEAPVNRSEAVSLGVGLEYMRERQIPDRPLVTSLPIEPWSVTLELLPDYSLINAEVYLNFTVQCILQENTLDILSQVEDRSLREVEGLPSWVPDYSVRLTDKIIPLIRAKGNNLPNPNRFSAGGQEPPEVNWSVNNPHALKAAGQTLGAIRVVSNPDTAALGLGGCAKEWMSMADALREQDLRETSPLFSPAVPGGSFAPSPSPVEAAYAGVWLERMGMPPCQKPAVPALITAWDRYLPAVMATLGMGYKKSPRLSDKTWEHFLAFLFLIKAQSCSATSDFEELMEQDEISEEYFPNIYRNMEPYLAIIKGVVAGRRIALTENADICFVPKSTNVGDEVCVLKGARTPYILRPLQGSGDRYQFVGEAFIRSRMGGEGLTDVWTSFVLE